MQFLYPPNNSNNKTESEEKLHYESLTSYLKTIVSIAGTAIGIMAGVAIYFSYSNVKDMKDDLKEIKKDYAETVIGLHNQIVDLKKDAKETALQIKEDSRDAVNSTKEFSENEISRISVSTRQTALDETQKQLANIFETDKIKNLIQNQAVKEIKSKMTAIVDEQTQNMSAINDAASEMRIERPEGTKKLKAYFQNPVNVQDSLQAKKLYDQISQDYMEVINRTDTAMLFKYYYSQIDTSASAVTKIFIPIHITNNKLPIDSNERKELDDLMKVINNKKR